MYEAKLAEIGLETLELRRKRLDLIQDHKIIHADDSSADKFFRIQDFHPHNTQSVVGGNIITQHRSRLELREYRYSFSNRVATPLECSPSGHQRDA